MIRRQSDPDIKNNTKNNQKIFMMRIRNTHTLTSNVYSARAAIILFDGHSHNLHILLHPHIFSICKLLTINSFKLVIIFDEPDKTIIREEL